MSDKIACPRMGLHTAAKGITPESCGKRWEMAWCPEWCDTGRANATGPRTDPDHFGYARVRESAFVVCGHPRRQREERPRTCVRCGQEYTSRAANSKYCPACKPAIDRERKLRHAQTHGLRLGRVCPSCGGPPPASRTYCSDACRDAAWTKPCLECGKPIVVAKAKHKTCCSGPCRRARMKRAYQQRLAERGWDIACVVCGRAVRTLNPLTRSCSMRCHNRLHNRPDLYEAAE